MAQSAVTRSIPRPQLCSRIGHRRSPRIRRSIRMSFELRPDLLVGPASNTRQKDETRRYDGSDYELVRLTQNDYREMAGCGNQLCACGCRAGAMGT